MAKLSDRFGGWSLIDRVPSGTVPIAAKRFGETLMTKTLLEAMAGTEVAAWDVVTGTGAAGKEQRLLVFTVVTSGFKSFSTYIVSEDSCTGFFGPTSKTCLGGYRVAGRLDTWFGYDDDSARATCQSVIYSVTSKELGGASLRKVFAFQRIGRLTFTFDAFGQYDVVGYDASDTQTFWQLAQASFQLSDEAIKAACKKELEIVAGGLTAAGAALAGEAVGAALVSGLTSIAFATESAGLLAASAAVALTPAVGVAIAGIAFGAVFIGGAILLADKLCSPEVDTDGTRKLHLSSGSDSGEDCMAIYTYEVVAYDCGYQETEYSDDGVVVTWVTKICYLISVIDVQIVCA